MKTYLPRASNLKSTITFLALVSKQKSISGARQKQSLLAIFTYNPALLHTSFLRVY